MYTYLWSIRSTERNGLGFQVIGMEACSGGGCSWACKSILGCPGVLEMVGCDRMAPPLNKCDSSESLEPSYGIEMHRVYLSIYCIWHVIHVTTS